MRNIKIILSSLLVLVLALGIAIFLITNSLKPKVVELSTQSPELSATRMFDNPILSTDMHPMLIEESQSYGYKNINGPSLIKVPSWVDNPLGKYYLYFAHHKGEYIRLAYTDSLDGQWYISSYG